MRSLQPRSIIKSRLIATSNLSIAVSATPVASTTATPAPTPLIRPRNTHGPTNIRLHTRRTRRIRHIRIIPQRVFQQLTTNPRPIGTKRSNIISIAWLRLRLLVDRVCDRDGQVEDRVVVAAVEAVGLVDADIVVAAGVAGAAVVGAVADEAVWPWGAFVSLGS